MDFDPRTPEYLQGLRASTWYIQGAHIEVTAPHAYALQGLFITPGHPNDEPGGVVRLFAPGQVSKIEHGDIDSAQVGTIRGYLTAVGGGLALEYVTGDARVQVA